MSDSRTFTDIDRRTWERIKALGRQQHGTVFAPAEGLAGTATTSTPVGTVVIAYTFDPGSQHLTYTIVNKPFLVPAPMIWDGIERAVEACSRAP